MKEAWIPVSLSRFCRIQESEGPDTWHAFHSSLFQLGYLIQVIGFRVPSLYILDMCVGVLVHMCTWVQ